MHKLKHIDSHMCWLVRKLSGLNCTVILVDPTQDVVNLFLIFCSVSLAVNLCINSSFLLLPFVTFLLFSTFFLKHPVHELPSEISEDDNGCNGSDNRRQVSGDVDIDQLSTSLQRHQHSASSH